MKRYVASPAALARFRDLCLVMLGAFALMLLQVLQDLVMLLLTAPTGHPAVMSYALSASELACILLAATIALRFVRSAKLPGAPSLLGLLALVWTMVLLGHYS
jgi:hypothetical protein